MFMADKKQKSNTKNVQSSKTISTKKVVLKHETTTSSKKVDTSMPVHAKPKVQTKPDKTIYHVSKRENDGREWKVFIQGSTKVIKLFPTQLEALEYAKDLCENKDDGSYVLLHGLDGKIRKY